jgi:sugar O-acyltransferase (sialic acid O-acetyltransferase NeuD family)
LLVLGAGGTSADLIDIVAEINERRPTYELLGMLDDDPAKRGLVIGGAAVLGSLADVVRWPGASLANALGGPGSYRRRPDLVGRLALPSNRYATVVHPDARVSPSSRLGVGALVYPGVVICARATVGDHVTLLSNTVINHDTRVGAFSIAASGVNVSGAVTVGECCYLGAGSTVIQGVSIGQGTMVGAGSVVVRDVPAGSTVVGVPARLLRRPTGSAVSLPPARQGG